MAPALCDPSPPSPSAAARPVISDCILLFVRAPELGRVKTRLAAEIGARAALRVYRRLAEHAVAEARAVGDDVALRIHFTPANAGEAVRTWLGGEGAAYLPQADADLGGRMRAAFEAAFSEGHRRVVIIGSDLPGLTAELLRDAFAGLDHHPAVIGPAEDGGYYLLGLREMIPELFHGIPWSTGEVFGRTMAKLRSLGITPARLPALGDVDVAADLPDGWREWALEESGVAA
ncbi:MAG TPA: TIGR04282 family arsenosugar biosynthesis glycosyltransferase [Longimicrobium sp.]|nr:TIGR04282 family arsenosugar biosynthesis glycosyltransferase [Longimicrobium sp.]